MEHFLHLKALLPVQALNAGYLVTKGRGRHVERTMDTFEIIYVNSGTLGIFEEDMEYDVEKGRRSSCFRDAIMGEPGILTRTLLFTGSILP